MSVDLRGLYIAVPELLLHCAYVRPGLEQMGGKGVAQCVARNSLANTAILSRFLYQFVQVILIKMMSPQAASCGVDAQPGRREEVMPVKIKRCGGILTGKSVRQPHPGVFRCIPVSCKNSLNLADMLSQW